MVEVARGARPAPPAYVKGVVTFYTMYHQHPVGTPFHSGLHDDPVQSLRRRGRRPGVPRALGLRRAGRDVPGRPLHGVEVECLGACGFATPVLIDDDFIEG